MRPVSEGSVFINVLLCCDHHWTLYVAEGESKESYLKKKKKKSRVFKRKGRDECVNVIVFCILPFFSPEPAVIRKTIKPKIIIINLTPRLFPSKGVILHKCLCRDSIRACKKKNVYWVKQISCLFAVKETGKYFSGLNFHQSRPFCLYPGCDLRSCYISFFFWFDLLLTCLWRLPIMIFLSLVFCTWKVI